MMAPGVIGWDIGGVHTKAARIVGGRVVARASRVYEVQKAPDALAALVRTLRDALGASADDRHAVTFTAELSQHFRTKAEGVAWVLAGVRSALPETAVRVVGIDRPWYALDEAERAWPMVAAANWMATARLVARHAGDALLVDVGSTTTDIIPVEDGAVAALGQDDPGRLATGELVYCGAARTPVEALVADVPVPAGRAGVSAEGFALTGDVHVWLGTLAPEAYGAFTPDGRPTTREFCGERLARVVCADRSMLDAAALDAIARHVAEAQVDRIAAAVARVRQRHPGARGALCVGLGSWLAERAAARAGLEVLPLPPALADAAVIAPAAAAGLLLDADPPA